MGGGVRGTCSIKVEAHVWGVQSAIELWMMAEAKRNLIEFFPFMSEFFRLHSKATTKPAILEPPEGVIDLVVHTALCSAFFGALRTS
jgi:hypothetical protein